MLAVSVSFFFFFNDTATTEIYTLSLHDALPISHLRVHSPAGARALRSAGLDPGVFLPAAGQRILARRGTEQRPDRKSTRLNSSHGYISYAVFCLKKKKKAKTQIQPSIQTIRHTR